MPWVHIWDWVIIGLNSVVWRDIPPYTIAAGNPCVVKKKRPNLHFLWNIFPRNFAENLKVGSGNCLVHARTPQRFDCLLSFFLLLTVELRSLDTRSDFSLFSAINPTTERSIFFSSFIDATSTSCIAQIAAFLFSAFLIPSAVVPDNFSAIFLISGSIWLNKFCALSSIFSRASFLRRVIFLSFVYNMFY